MGWLPFTTRYFPTERFGVVIIEIQYAPPRIDARISRPNSEAAANLSQPDGFLTFHSRCDDVSLVTAIFSSHSTIYKEVGTFVREAFQPLALAS